jgi:hypothetical protein
MSKVIFGRHLGHSPEDNEGTGEQSLAETYPITQHVHKASFVLQPNLTLRVVKSGDYVGKEILGRGILNSSSGVQSGSSLLIQVPGHLFLPLPCSSCRSVEQEVQDKQWAHLF